jgi:hypothetical protein
LELRLAKVKSADAYRGNLFPCAAERPMRNFSLDFSCLGVPRETHQHGGTGSDSQKLPASNRCVVTGLAFLFILAPNSRSITGIFTAHRAGILLTLSFSGWLICSGFWFPPASMGFPSFSGVLRSVSTSSIGLGQPHEATILSFRTHRAESGSQLFLCSQRANVRHKAVNLVLAERTLEGRHSGLAVGNYLSEFRIGQLLDGL